MSYQIPRVHWSHPISTLTMHLWLVVVCLCLLIPSCFKLCRFSRPSSSVCLQNEQARSGEERCWMWPDSAAWWRCCCSLWCGGGLTEPLPSATFVRRFGDVISAGGRRRHHRCQITVQTGQLDWRKGVGQCRHGGVNIGF